MLVLISSRCLRSRGALASGQRLRGFEIQVGGMDRGAQIVPQSLQNLVEVFCQFRSTLDYSSWKAKANWAE